MEILRGIIMIMYKGYKAAYLGLKRWKIFVPDNGMIFDIKVSRIADLIERIDVWRMFGWA